MRGNRDHDSDDDRTGLDLCRTDKRSVPGGASYLVTDARARNSWFHASDDLEWGISLDGNIWRFHTGTHASKVMDTAEQNPDGVGASHHACQSPSGLPCRSTGSSQPDPCRMCPATAPNSLSTPAWPSHLK